MKQEFYHEPVLLNETTGFLLQNKSSSENKIYVDATLGGGGYTGEILRHTANDTNIIAIDRDIFSIEHCKEYLVDYKDRILFCLDNFSNIAEILTSSLKKLRKERISGIVLDLCLSSFQINKEAGFSYLLDTTLDMRADKSQDFSAKDLINSYSEKELEQIFKEYGELRYSRNLAKDIVAYRKGKDIESTFDLVEAVKEKIPARFLNKELSKLFQAIRIVVNDELENLRTCLNDVVEFLEQEARIVVISYHSLEDRMVKNFLRSSKELKVLTKKVVLSSDVEIGKNVRARSAKLRAAEKNYKNEKKQKYRNIVI